MSEEPSQSDTDIRLQELEQEVADQALKIERLAKHVETLHNAVASGLHEIRGFGTEVLKHLDTLSKLPNDK